MKLEKIGKKKGRSLYGSFLWMTLFPMCLSGIAMIFTCTFSIRNSIESQNKEQLRSTANVVLEAYEEMYKGDYNITMTKTRTTLWKGDKIMSGNYEFLDSVAENSGVDISIFFYDTRLMTTVTDKNGDRVINTGLNSNIFEEVFTNGREAFYDNIRIAGVDYLAYYAPIYSADGAARIGVIGIAKPSKAIDEEVNKSVWINLGVIVIAMAITSVFILRFASSIISVIKKMMDFLRELSNNNLDENLDESVSYREDELGVMGRFMIQLQSSLKKLIERDVLTGLYNRRSAEKKIDEIELNCKTYCVAIGDIDHFKNFNDSFGHECGDVVLKEVANLLKEQMKGHGFVARWGGEEFLLVYENKEEDSAYVALLAIRDALHQHEVEYNGQIHKVTMTFGLAMKQENLPINKLIRMADDKLYEGKQGGRDRVCR